MKQAAIISLICFLVLLSACNQSDSGSPQIVVRDAWIRSATMMESSSNSNDQMHMSGTNSAAYMLIENRDSEPDKLVGATSSICEAVETHTSQTNNGVTRMIQVNGIEIPPAGEVELKPGSLHLMLINLHQDLLEGQKIQIKLEFKRAGSITVEAEVRSP